VSLEPVYLPKIGMQMQEAMVARWLKVPGDTVAAGEPVCVIETDKVEAEIEAEVAGTLIRIEVAEGASATVGQALAVIETMG
jgi:pyruvate/2-oxoglutarate dehydrogenase complex dihydrolipoamide acyltransferase (E2) component